MGLRVIFISFLEIILFTVYGLTAGTTGAIHAPFEADDSAMVNIEAPAGALQSGVVITPAMAITPSSKVLTSLLSEGFESGGQFPWSPWSVWSAEPGDYGIDDWKDVKWGPTTYTVASGAYSLWCGGAGADRPTPGADIPTWVFAWAFIGPFDLTNATSGDLDFDLWLETEEDPNNVYDYFHYTASLNGQNFRGPQRNTNTNGYEHITKDLQTWEAPDPADPDNSVLPILGQSEVWFAFIYKSDQSETFKGAFLDNVNVTVNGGGTPPAANFTWSPTTPTMNQTVSFTDTSSGPPTSWLWDFDDGSTSSVRNPSHSFSAAGSYAVHLTVANADGSSSISRTVTVSSGGGGVSATYTTNADFDQGALIGLEHDTVGNQLQLSASSSALPFLWVPNSNTHSISKIDTNTGYELGRYYVGPTTVGQNSSRTTVDLQGNCWVGNRGAGTAVKVGLYEAGQCYDRNNNGSIQTSIDTNGDGDITGAEILPWGSDECVLWEVVLINGATGTYRPGDYTGSYSANYLRAVAIDASNNVWAGVYNDKKYYYINNQTGQVQRTIDVSSTGTRPYGAVVDRNGNLWSASWDDWWVLRINPNSGELTKVDLPHRSYGLGLDSSGHLFVSGYYSEMSRINIASATVDWTVPTIGGVKGVALTDDNDVWLAGNSSYQVGRYSNSGTQEAAIDLGMGPTGVAVDSNGKVWSMGDTSGAIKRINPATNTVDLTKDLVGTSSHYGYSDMTGIVARTVTTRIGTWAVNHDSGQSNTSWGTISWNGYQPAGTSIVVRVRSSNNLTTWSNWETTSNGAGLSSTANGRYLQIEVTLQITSGDVSPILYDLTVASAGGAGLAPSANFTWSPSSPQAGQSVQFADTSSNTPTSWSWNFNDGGSSSQQHPQHSFSAAGAYAVSLSVSNSSGSDSVTKNITVSSVPTCQLTCTATVPATGQVGVPITFTSTATATNCSSQPSYFWYPDLTTTAMSPGQTIPVIYDQAGTYNWELDVVADNVTCRKTGAISISSVSVPCNYTYWVPVAIHAAGANQSKWRTDLGLFGSGFSTAAVEVRFHGAAGYRTRTTSVGPKSQVILADVVDWLSAGLSDGGAVEVCAGAPLQVTSRTFNLLSSSDPCTPNGTFGQYLDGEVSSNGLSNGQSAWLPHLRENAAFRCNLGFVNTGTSTATVSIQLYNASGSVVHQYSFNLSPNEWWQDNRPFASRAGLNNLSAGSARVTVSSGSGVVAYGSLVDNETNDPTTIPMKR